MPIVRGRCAGERESEVGKTGMNKVVWSRDRFEILPTTAFEFFARVGHETS